MTTDILKKVKDWDFTNDDSSITLNLDYIELAEIADTVDRKLWFVGEVTDEVIGSIVYNILRYNAIDKDIPIEKRKPILLYISSVGGDVTVGLGLISAIETSLTPVYTVTLADACSMGLAIAIAGKKRYSMPNTVYLMHDGSTGVIDSMGKARDRLEFDSKDLAERMKSIILNHTNLTKKQYDEKYRKEWYFFPDTAKKYGFTDYIIGEDCDINEIV